jgi:hypothetical protein
VRFEGRERAVVAAAPTERPQDLGEAGVDEAVAVGRSAAEVAALLGGLVVHRRQDSVAGAEHFALRLGGEQRHERTVITIAQVDGASRFGRPQLDAVSNAPGVYLRELRAGEGALILADHDRINDPLRPGGLGHQPRRCVRCGHGLRREVPTSKWAATIWPWPAIRSLAMSRCHPCDDTRSWWRRVEVRP